MYVPDEKMRINRFKSVAIPRNADYLVRLGMSTLPASMYTGEEMADLPKQKVDVLAYAEQYDAMMQREELKREADGQ